MYPMTMAIDLFQVTVDRVRNDRPAALQQTAARLMSGYSSDVGALNFEIIAKRAARGASDCDGN
jgi:hypothetical protein